MQTLHAKDEDSQLGTVQAPLYSRLRSAAIVLRRDGTVLSLNPEGREWMDSVGISEKVVGFEKLFLPVDETWPMERILGSVKDDGMARIGRFHQPGETATRHFAFLFSPLNGDDEADVLVQPIQADNSQGDRDSWTQSLSPLAQEHGAELFQLNGFLNAIVDSSTETSIIAISASGTILSFNEGACRMFQYPRTDVVGRLRAAELFQDAEDGAWEDLHRKAREEGKCQQLLMLRRRDGTVFPSLVDLTPLRDSNRQSLGLLMLSRDMTDTLQTQRALEEKQEQLEFLNTLALSISQTLELEAICAISLRHLMGKFNGILGGLYLKNRNDGSLRLTAVEPADRSRRLMQLLQPSQDDFILAEEGEVLLHDLSHMSFIQGADGIRTPATRLILPLLPKASFVGLLVILARDRVVRSEETLSFLSALGTSIGGAIENAILYFESLSKSVEIRKQNQELDEFAYIISHDLKEPLAGISFISNLLVDEYYESFDATARTYINNLKDFSQRLGSLIDALLELSRIGRVNSPYEETKIIDVIHNVSQSLSYRIATKDTQLKLPEDLPTVYGEKTRIEQVFFNLLSNAIKFNDKDRVVIEIEWREEEDRFILFSIKDNGIGIEERYFESIFKIFERLHQREEYEGNGAGLTIVKKIIEHHGGRIWLESELGAGTTFHFTLPKNQPSNMQVTP